MPTYWTSGKSLTFWANRKWRIMRKDNNIDTRIAGLNTETATRAVQQTEATKAFLQRYSGKHNLQQSSTKYFKNETKALQFWVQHSSWTFCEKCKQLLPQKLFPRIMNTPVLKSVKTCTCKAKRYLVPRYKNIPKELR